MTIHDLAFALLVFAVLVFAVAMCCGVLKIYREFRKWRRRLEVEQVVRESGYYQPRNHRF
jgi:hypothetical protein